MGADNETFFSQSVYEMRTYAVGNSTPYCNKSGRLSPLGNVFLFLAAPRSSRSPVVGPSVGPLVGIPL